MKIFKWILLWILMFITTFTAAEQVEKFSLKSFDGFKMETVVEMPDGLKNSDIKRVVIFLHGSGPQNMDEDLTEVSAPGVKNLFFADVSKEFVKNGFTVIRYNKRSFEMGKKIRVDKDFIKSKFHKKFMKNPLKYFVKDARHYAKWAQKRFPKASIYFLGHSQGAGVGLWAANETPEVDGVALIGFAPQSLDTLMFIQTVYRPLWIFESLDKNNDAELDKNELKGENKYQKTFLLQMPIIDLNKDEKLQKSEFMAGNLSNIFLDINPTLKAYRTDILSYPSQAEIIKNAKFKIAFFQGELDNQTPSYNAKTVQLLNNIVWKKNNLIFHFYSGLGHALDKRKDFNDLIFQQIDSIALKDMVSKLDIFWQ
ncbi:MAG: alpha/beta hydrolase [Elusimicrobia bacterium]|nr:alpha/beta hydrolase [Elusimicrobiota bacterium]